MDTTNPNNYLTPEEQKHLEADYQAWLKTLNEDRLSPGANFSQGEWFWKWAWVYYNVPEHKRGLHESGVLVSTGG